MKRLLLGFIIMATWMVVSCGTTVTMKRGCWGYVEDERPIRGTLLKNRTHSRPYRQCVDKKFPHRNTHRESL